MPSRLRPTAPYAVDAILVGDPGRALLLAQELLEQPKMCNHARGLWGYSGQTPAGEELTIQTTGMGGPSAALVLSDLAELGVRRAVRVGTCSALEPGLRPGALLAIREAREWAGPAEREGTRAEPDPGLAGRLRHELGAGAGEAIVASLDVLHRGDSESAAYEADVADMQTAALFARGRALGVALAAVLIVVEGAGGTLGDEELEMAARESGEAAARALSNPQVEA
jgi:uridine phosphorylase